MAEQRSFLKRSLEILGGTAIDIGKDYTANLQTLKSDAENIKSSITDGIGTAKDTFTKLKSGQGPIKGLLNWFYNKEGETDMWDLDDPDSDFDAGFDVGDDDENEGPGTLDLQGAKDIARGQANSMYKIATKIAETQVANTSEIISTLNSRTSEIIAATNNINTTLMGISKKLDTVIAINNQPKKKDNFESLYDYNGRLTLGSVFDASKRSVANNDALSMLSLLKTMGGMMGPQDVLKTAFEWTIGAKDRKWLGNQSINQVGEKINEAIGQSISDLLDNVISTKAFKKIFGDLKKETRSTNFETYIKNEYTKDPAVFDGMTRTSIVKVIPEYLKLIYQGISGTTINVDKSGNLTTGMGNTWAGAVKRQTNRTAFGWDARDYATNYIKEHTGQTLTSNDASLLGLMITQVAISMMADNGVAYFNKEWLRPDGELQRRVLWYFRQFGDKYGGRTFSEWVEITRVFLMSLSLDKTQKNKLAAEINDEYQRAMKDLSGSAQTVRDQNKVGKLGDATQAKALLDIMNDRGAVEGNKPGYNATDAQIKSFVTGNGPEIGFSMSDTLNDIKTLLSAGVQKLIGNKRFAIISGKLKGGTTGIVLDASAPAEPTDIVYDEERRKKNEKQSQNEVVQQLKSELTIENAKSGLGEVGKAIKSGVQAGKGYLYDAVKGTDIPEWYGRMKESDAYKAAMEAGGNAVDAVKSAWGSAKVKASDALDDIKARGFGFMNSRFEKTVDWAKEHGNNHDQEIVAMVASYIQTSVQNGSVSQDEKNSIHRLIDSIEDSKLRAKLSKSVDTMLKHASWKAEGEGETGKKSILGKVLAGIGLLLSPLNLIKKAIVTFVPMIGRGIWNLSKKLFAPDLQDIRAAGHVFSEGWQEFREGRREYREYKKSQDTGKVYNRYTGQEEDRYTLGNLVGESVKDLKDALKNPDHPLGKAVVYTKGFFADIALKGIDGIKFLGNKLVDAGYFVAGLFEKPAKAVMKAGKALGKATLTAAGFAINGIKAIGGGIKKFLTVPGIISKAIHKIGDKAIEASEKLGKGRIAKWMEQRRSIKEEKGETRATFWGALREGMSAVPGAIEEFKKQAGIKTGSDRVEGIDEAPQTFTDKVLAKLYNFFKKNREDDEAKEEQEKEAQRQAEEAEKNAANNPDSNGNQQTTGGTQSGDEENQSAGSGLGSQITEGAENIAGTLSNAGGPLGKIAPMITKIAGGVGKMVGSLGSIGMSVLKIVGKAILMLSGFKALKETLGSVTNTLVKVVQIGLEPLNKIFHALNKMLKPLIKILTSTLKSIMDGVSQILDAFLKPFMEIIQNVFMPLVDMLKPVLNVIIKVLEPMFKVITWTVEKILTPIMWVFKKVIEPTLNYIKYGMDLIIGAVEFIAGNVVEILGKIMVGVGSIWNKIVWGESDTANSLIEKGKEFEEAGGTLLDDSDKRLESGWNGLKQTFYDQFFTKFSTDDEEVKTNDISVENPNAVDAKNIGSVMDGYASGDVDSHNMTWNIQNIYGSGNRSQGSYGGALSMRENGCGPMALADAYNRRTGSSVDGLSLARSMSRSGSYEPGRGTSVGSFTNSARALGMGLTPGGVTQASLKHASPNNPITVIGSGSDFGTRKGNNHYMNVIGTDSYGGAYVSNPMTGRVDRRSASTLASSSVLGLYGSGDNDVSYYQFPDAVSNAIAELKNLAKSLLGIFTGPSETDELDDLLSDKEKESQLSELEKHVKVAHESDPDNNKSWEEYQNSARDSALNDWAASNPRKAGETEDEYNKRFEKWYTPAKQYTYLAKTKAIEEVTENYNKNATSAIGAFKTAGKGFREASSSTWDIMKEAAQRAASAASSGGSGGKFTADNGVALWTDPYADNIEITETNIQGNDDYHSPLFEFFAKTMGGKLGDVRGSGWFSRYNNPNNEGVGSSGNGHGGIDFYNVNGSLGKPLFATTGGIVEQSQSASSGVAAGNNIMWKDTGGMYHWYMHMKNPSSKKKGDTVDPGEKLGEVGNTGECYGSYEGGAHLHYTIRDTSGGWSSDSHSINPLLYFKNYKPNGNLYGSTYEQKIWSYLTSNGASKEAAAGFMGNWQVESSNNPQHIEGYYYWPQGDEDPIVAAALTSPESMNDYTVNKLFPKYRQEGTPYMLSGYNEDGEALTGNYYAGMGLAQWTGPRTKSLMEDAKSSGRDIKDLSLQLDKWKSDVTGPYSGALASANAKDSPEGAAQVVLERYEGVNNGTGPLRQQYAREIYNRLKDWNYTQNTSPTGAGDPLTGFGMVNSAGDAKGYSNVKQTGTWSGKNTGTVEADPYLRLRADKTTNSADLAHIPDGTKLELEASGDSDWYKTSYNGQTGYVSSRYIHLDDNYFDSKGSTKPTINSASDAKKYYNASNVLTYQSSETPTILGTNNNYITNTQNLASGGTYGTVTAPQITSGSQSDNRGGSYSYTWTADTDNLSGAVKKLYGKGDSDIPPVDESNFIYDEYTKIATNAQAQDDRISKLMNHTYEVHAEGVERLLERIIEIIDKDDNPNPKPVGSNESMFKDNSIPKAVQRLSQ